MTLETANVIAFIGVTDGMLAKEFYREKLGLRHVADELPQALVFDTAGTMLRVSAVTELQPASYTVLGWDVDDIEATVDDLTGRGVQFNRFPPFQQDERAVWTAPDGTRIAWFSDPDGNVLSVTQFPEGTVT